MSPSCSHLVTSHLPFESFQIDWTYHEVFDILLAAQPGTSTVASMIGNCWRLDTPRTAAHLAPCHLCSHLHLTIVDQSFRSYNYRDSSSSGASCRSSPSHRSSPTFTLCRFVACDAPLRRMSRCGAQLLRASFPFVLYACGDHPFLSSQDGYISHSSTDISLLHLFLELDSFFISAVSARIIYTPPSSHHVSILPCAPSRQYEPSRLFHRVYHHHDFKRPFAIFHASSTTGWTFDRRAVLE